MITTYKEPDSYEPHFCDRQCEDCHLQLKLEGADEWKAVGIQQLLDDHDKSIALVPASNARHNRRNDE